MTIYGDGNYLRDYVYISDVVRALILAGFSQGLSGQSFNIGSGVGVTISNAFKVVAREVERLTSRFVEIEYIDWPAATNPIEMRSFVANIDKYTALTGWKPVIDFTNGITHLVSECQKNISCLDGNDFFAPY